MIDVLNLEVHNQLSELNRLISSVQSFGLAHQWEDSFCRRVQLIVEELLVNIISYGCADDKHVIRFSIISTEETVHITIEDDTQPFNPIAHPTPAALDAAIDDRGPGGLGLHFVKTMVDEMTYERRDEKNILTLKKKRQPV